MAQAAANLHLTNKAHDQIDHLINSPLNAINVEEKARTENLIGIGYGIAARDIHLLFNL